MFPFQSGVQPLSAFARASTLRGCFAESRKLKVACRVPGADSSKSVVHDDGRRKGPGPEALEAGVFALRSLEEGARNSFRQEVLKIGGGGINSTLRTLRSWLS